MCPPFLWKHFFLQIAKVRRLHFVSQQRNGLSWCRIAFAKASYYGTCQIQHKERWQTQNLSKQSCLNLAHDPKDGQLHPQTLHVSNRDANCLWDKFLLSMSVQCWDLPFVFQLVKFVTGVLSGLDPMCMISPHLEIVVWSTENGSTWSTVPHFAMVHSSKNEYACYEMLWKLLCAGEMWMEWGWWDQYPPKRMRSLHIVDSKYLWEINIIIYNQKNPAWFEPHVRYSKMHTWSYLIQLAKPSNFSNLIDPISMFVCVFWPKDCLLFFVLSVCMHWMLLLFHAYMGKSIQYKQNVASLF